MKRIALLLATCASGPVMAQVAGQVTPPPVRQSIDENGVNVLTGAYYERQTDLVIGPNASDGISFQRISGVGGVNSLLAVIELVGGKYIVTLDGKSDSFTSSGGGFVSTEGNGAALTLAGGIYTYTSSNGTIARFAGNSGYTYSFYEGELARLGSVTYPDGSSLTSTLKVQTICPAGYEGNVCQGPLQYIGRLQSMRHSNGWQMKFGYALNTTKVDADNFGEWGRITSITGINNAVEYCDPAADTCTLTGNWPKAQYTQSVNGSGELVRTAADALNRITTYTSGGSALRIKRPAAASDSTVVTYGSSGVASITDEGVTHSYAYSDSGSTRTTTVTAPDSSTRVYIGDTTTFLLSSYRDELNRTTSYSYDASGRVTQVIYPEGNKVQYTYDARGNVTEQRAISKTPGTPADIVTTAIYASSCTNPVTCNKPVSATDAKGNVTDFTYDATHGGVLTVTRPAPTSGAVRPQTRYGYEVRTAFAKASAGGSPIAGPNTYKLTSVSACQTTASCAGGADEVKTTVGYGPQTTGTPNNLLPVTVSSGSGNGTLTATTTATWDNVGNRTYVDGPLSGTADTTRTLYDAARQVVGIIGPDPDGAGALLNRAARVTYNLDGQATLTEAGTTNGQSDSAWSAFSPLQAVASTYDSNTRKTTDKAQSGSTTYTLTQYSYDALGRPECTAVRMNTTVFGSLPSSACTLGVAGSFGDDRITKAAYNAASQIAGVTSGYGTADQADDMRITSYTANGNPYWLVDANGNVTTQTYDGHDRPDRIVMPSPTSPGSGNPGDYEQYTYDANGNITSRRLRDGQVISYTYDSLNRLTAKDRPNGSWWDTDYTYAYDLLGRLTTATHGNGYGLAYSFGYDALGRTTSAANSWYGNGFMTYQYDLAGRRTRATWGDGFFVDYSRYVTGEVVNIRENGVGTGIGVLGTYFYDDLGRRTHLYRGNGNVTTYSYDAVSRLTTLSHDLAGTTNDVTTTFSYTPASQIAASTRTNDAYAYPSFANKDATETPNGLNQLTQQASTALGYDARGNVASIGSAPYGYSSENELIYGAGPGSGYAYNPFGQLFNENLGGGTNITFQYDGTQIATESDAGTAAVMRRYVYGPGTDDPLVWYEGSGTSDRRWLIPDERGTVVAVTDTSGTATSINRYDDYGTPASTNTGRFGYTGQAWLPGLGMNYYKARIYNPAIGRFMQTDPIGYGSGMNIYAYVGGDPVNRVDPSGLAYLDYGQCTGTLVCKADGNGKGSLNGPGSSVDQNISHEIKNPGSGGRRTNKDYAGDATIVVTAASGTSGGISLSSIPGVSVQGNTPQNEIVVTASYKPGGNVVIPRAFDPLDPTRLNRPLLPIELSGISTVLNILSGNDSRRAMALNPHRYNNYPSPTGAQLPPSPKGYTSFDAFVTSPRGSFRVIIDNASGQVYYTNNHYDSFYQIVTGP